MILLNAQFFVVFLNFYATQIFATGLIPDRAEAKASFFGFLFGACNCRCGLSNRQARPSAGENLHNYEFPWLAIVQMKEKDFALGTLINNRHVITTASNLIGFTDTDEFQIWQNITVLRMHIYIQFSVLTPFDVKVTLGQNNRCHSDISSLNVSIEQIIPHKEFNVISKLHDIAILKLSTIINFEKRISPICLSTPQSTYVGQVATFVGWSEYFEDNQKIPHCQPRKLGLPVLDVTDCPASVIDPRFTTWDKRCAGIIGTRNVMCKWDQGGPVMYRSYGGIYELIGIVSEMNDCNGAIHVTLFTSINDHLQWIIDNTKGACYCYKTH